jgi:hypothetical protein
MLNINFPPDIRSDPDMELLWRYTNTIISIANDMLSFKKEIEHGRLHNLVTLLYLERGSLQSAMNGAFEKVVEAKLQMDEVGKRLERRFGSEGDVATFVDCCKTMCVGKVGSWHKFHATHLANLHCSEFLILSGTCSVPFWASR